MQDSRPSVTDVWTDTRHGLAAALQMDTRCMHVCSGRWATVAFIRTSSEHTESPDARSTYMQRFRLQIKLHLDLRAARHPMIKPAGHPC